MTHSELYEFLDKIASENNAQVIETTKGANGYPEQISWAIALIEDTTDLCAIRRLYPKTRFRQVKLHKRDGWHFWEIKGDMQDDFFDLEEVYRNNDWHTYDASLTTDADLIEEFMEELNSADPETLDDIHTLLRKYEEISDCLSYSDPDFQFVAQNGGTPIIVNNLVMHYEWDTHHYAIGLILAD